MDTSAGLTELHLYTQDKDDQKTWLLIYRELVEESHAVVVVVEFICYVPGTKAHPGDGNHRTRGTCPEQA